ncbi:hypothetical protein QVD17_00783 [Tagetes erecta]|uniref:Uncharacterized protein n=1 Tax=Tagetes erecta TaxID=13708 RepID=A0AAD8L5S1_TARER|nr:hypothetical protein QVD17_00783 [Tagetes erecta]
MFNKLLCLTKKFPLNLSEIHFSLNLAGKSLLQWIGITHLRSPASETITGHVYINKITHILDPVTVSGFFLHSWWINLRMHV